MTAAQTGHWEPSRGSNLSADELLSVIQTLPDVVFRCERRRDGRIYWTLNEGRLAEEFHLTTREIEGRALDELFPGDAFRDLRAHFDAAFAGEGKEFINELGGRFFKHSPQPVRDASGRIVAVVGFITEVTAAETARREVAALNAQMVQRLLELREANEALEAFGYTVTHDLRGPLSSILLNCQLAAMDATDPAAQERIRRIRQAAERMGRLIEDLLQFSRAGRNGMATGAVDLSGLAAEVLDELRQTEPDRPMDLVVAPGLVASGDAGLLRQVLANLLSNAWKYTRTAPRGRVEVGGSAASGRLRLSVRDNGIGFDMDHAARLFEPFHRLDNAAPYEGTGIGLATVRKIVQRHGGRVWAEAKPGAGACFWVELPIPPPAPTHP